MQDIRAAVSRVQYWLKAQIEEGANKIVTTAKRRKHTETHQ